VVAAPEEERIEMSKRFINRLLLSIISLLFLMPVSIFAALGDGNLTENKDISLVAFLSRIQNWLLGFVGALAILFIVYGGFLYVTSSGNKERVEMAKKTLTYAILGLILVVLAGTILNIITGDFLTSIFGSKPL